VGQRRSRPDRKEHRARLAVTDSSHDPVSVPASLGTIRDDFLALDKNQDRLLLLLEFSDELPNLPPEYENHPDLFERVEECQAPVYIFPEVTVDGLFRLYATAPEEAPTTRGFASILVHGLSPLTAAEVLTVPDDFPLSLGLTEAVSPLRMRGMLGMLGRIKRSVRDQLEARKIG